MFRHSDLGGAATTAKGPIGLLAERSAVGRALDTAISGETRVVLIEGELGSGRSALLGAARMMATDRSMRIMSTQGRRTDSDIGYSCLLTLLSGVESELDQLAGSHASALRAALSLNAESTNAVDVGLGLFRVVTTLAERSPVAVLVDDIHLVDSATREALSFTLGCLDADSVAAVLTVPWASGSPLADVAHALISIGPRSIDELIEIAGNGIEVDPNVLAEVCARAAGNPLVAVAATHSLTPGQRLGLDPLSRVPKPPEALVRQFESTLGGLGVWARRALVMVAADLDGDRETIEAALVRLGEPPDGLREVASAGLVIVDGSQVRLAHPLLQEYAYLQVGGASRRAAHLALAETLAAPAQAAGRVWQLAAASDGQDDGLADSLELVADDALRRGDSAAAARALAKAAELTLDSERSRRRRRKAVRIMFEAGYPHDALGHLDGAGIGESAAPQFAAVRARLMRWIGHGDVFAPGGSVAESADRELDESDEKILVAEQDLLEGRCQRLVDQGVSGVAWDPCEYLVLRIRAMLALGMTGTAESLSAARLAVLGDRHSAVAAAVAAVRADVLAATGDLDGAMLLAEWSRPVLAARSLSSHLAELDRTVGRIAIARGDDAGAVSAFERIPVSEMHRAIGDLVLVLVRLGEVDAAVAWLRRLETRSELVPRIRRQCAEGLLGGVDKIKSAQKLAATASLPLEVAAALSIESAWLRMNSRDGEADLVEAKARAHLRPFGVRYFPTRYASEGTGEAEPAGGSTDNSAPAAGGVDTGSQEVTEVLSPAELRVAVSVAIGRTNKEAAGHLFISVKTVDFHLQNIYRKLGLRSRTELAVLMSATSLT